MDRGDGVDFRGFYLLKEAQCLKSSGTSEHFFRTCADFRTTIAFLVHPRSSRRNHWLCCSIAGGVWFVATAQARRFREALGRPITFQDIPVEPWRDGLLERGLAVHLVKHLATMADLHRAGRYDRMSDDVRTLTGRGPLSMQEFVRKNAATFTTSGKSA